MKDRVEILYIIGNGFDRWHGLPTSYKHFYEHAKDLLHELEQYLYSESGIEIPWHDFEACLGRFNCDLFYEAYNFIDVADESFKPSMVFGLEDELSEEADRLISGVRDQFEEWISGISIDDIEAQFHFLRPGRFISFNYTDVLQTVYGIPEDSILHIHGSAARYEQLIFGHGDEIINEPEFDDEGESNRTMFSDAQGNAKRPLYEFKKPVTEILKRNTAYFEALSNIETIVVLGHSLNEIDLPYFKAISAIASQCKWLISEHIATEREGHILRLSKCGIDLNKVSFHSISDISKVLSEPPHFWHELLG